MERVTMHVVEFFCEECNYRMDYVNAIVNDKVKYDMDYVNAIVNDKVKYEHVCKKCGAKELLNNIYPLYRECGTIMPLS